jgi:hypothetical protein
MKHFTFFLVAVAAVAGLVALVAPTPGHADGESAPFVTEIPHAWPRLLARTNANPSKIGRFSARHMD